MNKKYFHLFFLSFSIKAVNIEVESKILDLIEVNEQDNLVLIKKIIAKISALLKKRVFFKIKKKSGLSEIKNYIFKVNKPINNLDKLGEGSTKILD